MNFFYYDNRHKLRYVHAIGAAYMTGKGDGKYGMSLEPERYSYIFVQQIIGVATDEQALVYFIKQTTIHELGHQFGLNYHPADKPAMTGTLHRAWL